MARDRAFVEGVASALADGVERCGELRVGEDVAWLGHVAVREKRRGRHGIRGKFLLARFPLVADDLLDGIPVARVVGRGRDSLRHGDRSVLREQLGPAFHHARHCHRQDAGARHARLVALRVRIRRRRVCGSPAGVQRPQRLRLRVVDDGEEVAADAGHRRLDDREHSGGRDRGVNRVAAVLKHLQAGRRGQRLARCDHPVPGEHGRASAVRIRSGPIARTRMGVRTLCGSGHDDQAGDDGDGDRFHAPSRKTRVRRSSSRGSVSPSSANALASGDHESL